MVDAYYGVVAPHQAQGPISTAVCVQIDACTPNLLIQELFDEFNVDWEREIVTWHPTCRAGRHDRYSRRAGSRLRSESGSEVEKHPYQASNFLPLFAPGWEQREGESRCAGCDQDADRRA